MFKSLREQRGIDVSKAKKREPNKQSARRERSPLTAEQWADRNQRNRMKDRAAILSISKIDENIYQVWGGENPHVVQVMSDGVVRCDCQGWSSARHHVCSHVYKYLVVYGDLKK